MEVFLLGVLGSWVASVLVFPILPFQHWLNSKLRGTTALLRLTPMGLNGKWVAKYAFQNEASRNEDVTIYHLNGHELKGKIVDRDTASVYRFQAKQVHDEIVGYYWSTDGSKDIGNFKLKKIENHPLLKGCLSVFHDVECRTINDTPYSWHYLPPRYLRIFSKNVRKGRSKIDRAGVFTNNEFEVGNELGRIRLRKKAPQGEHTIKFNSDHYLVGEPWRYLNHSCTPNAEFINYKDRLILRTTKHLLPQEEITIDYNTLDEEISEPFKCNCPICTAQGSEKVIGRSKMVSE